jgi:prolyl oligopeptidase
MCAQHDFPPTTKEPVTDEYHGIRVTDEYRWLENGEGGDVRQWVAAQNAYTRSRLDKSPWREVMKRDLLAQLRRSSVRYSRVIHRSGVFFMIKRDPLKQQPSLVITRSLDDLALERTIVDPNDLNSQGHLAIDWYTPSLDGALVAIAMSEGGSEDSSLYIYEAASGKQTGEVIPRASYPTAGGSVAWLPDGKSFFYTRYPDRHERPESDLKFYQQVWLHRLGTPPDSDTYVLGRDFSRIAIIVLDSDAEGKYFLASVANGAGFEFEHFLRTPDGQWNQITRFEDQVVSVSIGGDEALYLISRKDAPRGKLLRLPIGSLSVAEATLIVPEGTASMERPVPESADKLPLVTASKIYVKTIDGGPNQISIYGHFGKAMGKVPLNGLAAVDNLIALQGDSVAFQTVGYLDPPTMCVFDGEKVRATAVRVSPQTDLSGLEVERVFAKSDDGTSVPMSIIHRKGLKRDGTEPTLIWGYGGYGISIAPAYLATSDFMLWLEQGGTLVLTNLRGGSEYGETWHQEGNLTLKQNVFDDFAACARYIIDQKYSSAARMAARGGSNGGLLMGAVLTQHPSYFRAVVSRVGIYDMLRFELDPNGAFNVTEFGSVKDPAQFKALYAYSPYHRVDDGVAYPAVLIMTGDNDGRANPFHSRKMTAKLQAATSSNNPILLRTTSTAGHGFGTALTEQVDESADFYAFIFDELGMRYGPPQIAVKR